MKGVLTCQFQECDMHGRKPPENGQMNNADHSQVVLLFFVLIQSFKKIIIGTGIDFL